MKKTRYMSIKRKAQRKIKSVTGRPTVMTEEIVGKLEHAFLMGCTDLEACFYAGISKQALYDYQDRHPSYVDRKERLKQNPIFLARTTLVDNLANNPELALKFLERKLKAEFSTRVETTGSDEDREIKQRTLKAQENIAVALLSLKHLKEARTLHGNTIDIQPKDIA